VFVLTYVRPLGSVNERTLLTVGAMEIALIDVALLLAACWLLRIVFVLRRGRSAQPSGRPPLRTMAVLGSGGHTAEILPLLDGLDPALYTPREYVLATSDATSAAKIEALEAARLAAGAPPSHALRRLPRSREVGQSYASSVGTTLWATLHAVALVFRARPAVLLCNGPGTCIPVALAALALRLLGVRYVTIVYVESVCRVTSLSLSGKLLLPLADHFLVQWPQLAHAHPKARYIGRLA